MKSFADFVSSVLVEELHPELHEIVTTDLPVRRSKRNMLVKKIKDLSSRGEKTGIEGNTPRGSSRMYLPHEDHEKITLDGKETSIRVGTKVAIKAELDKHHDHIAHDGHSLGQLQNKAEGGDHYVNSRFRILTQSNDKPNTFTSNHGHEDQGIFPPLISHDDDKNHWSTVGHAENLTKASFKKITKTESHPKGITHRDFFDTLLREHNLDHGKHWDHGQDHEAKMDHVAQHPLTQKFLMHQRETQTPPHDYGQIKNLGVFNHPDGSQHIVARDHGFDNTVMDAYRSARDEEWRV